MHQVKISNSLNCFDGLGSVDPDFPAVGAEETAAVTYGPDFKLPCQVLYHGTVLCDIVAIKAGLTGVSALVVKSKPSGVCKELIPAPGVLHPLWGSNAGSSEHILVVVHNKHYVCY